MGFLNQIGAAPLYSSETPYYTYGAPQGPLQPATPPQESQLAQQPPQQFSNGGQPTSHGAKLAALREIAFRPARPKQSRADAEKQLELEVLDNVEGYGGLQPDDMHDAVSVMIDRVEGPTSRNRARFGDQGQKRFVEGPGTGRSDDINAMLSDGEYVFDAETVALLGDGSSKAGASALDKLREKIRAHKGKALSKGKFSPDAKPAHKYLGGK